MTEGFKSSTVGISSLQPVQIHESELVKAADFDKESCEVEGVKLYDFLSKEKSSSIYYGRIRRPQSSVPQYSSMRESSYAGSLAYSGRSRRTDKNVDCPESGEQKIEENSTSLERGLGSCMVGSLTQLKQRKVGSRTNAVSAAPSLRVMPYLHIYNHYSYEDNLVPDLICQSFVYLRRMMLCNQMRIEVHLLKWIIWKRS